MLPPWYSPSMATNKLSRATYQRLEAELEDLKTRGRIQIAAHIEAARLLGRVSQSWEYPDAKEAQARLEARIGQLESILQNAEIVGTVVSGKVVAGVTVSLRYLGDDDVERYLVGSIEERDAGTPVVSPESPLGRALMGKKAGTTVTYEAPSGQLQVEIVSVGD